MDVKRFNPQSAQSPAGDTCSMAEATDGGWVRYEDAMAEIARLRKCLTPILRHAAGDDWQPPLRLNIAETRCIRDDVEG